MKKNMKAEEIEKKRKTDERLDVSFSTHEVLVTFKNFIIRS